jgi:hypothetical protein
MSVIDTSTHHEQDNAIKKIVIKYDEKGNYPHIPFAKRSLMNSPSWYGDNFLDVCRMHAYIGKDVEEVIFDDDMICKYYEMCFSAEEFTEIRYEVDPNLCFDATCDDEDSKNHHVSFAAFLRYLKAKCIKEAPYYWDKFITFTFTGFYLAIPIASTKNTDLVDCPVNAAPNKKIVIKYDKKGDYPHVPFIHMCLKNPPYKYDPFLNMCNGHIHLYGDILSRFFNYSMLSTYFNQCKSASKFTTIEYVFDRNLCFDIKSFSEDTKKENENLHVSVTEFLRYFMNRCKTVYTNIYKNYILFTPDGFRLCIPITEF